MKHIAKSAQTILRGGAFLVAGLLVVGPSPGAAKEKVIERYQFNAMGTGHYGFKAGRATRLKLVVYRWTTSTERQEIITMLGGDDGQAIVRDLEKREIVGRLMVPGQSGVDLRYLWKVEENGKIYVVGVSQRSLLSEPNVVTGTSPYYIAVLQIELGPSGKGNGVLLPGIYPRFNSNGTVTIEAQTSDPITLTSAVRTMPKSKK